MDHNFLRRVLKHAMNDQFSSSVLKTTLLYFLSLQNLHPEARFIEISHKIKTLVKSLKL